MKDSRSTLTKLWIVLLVTVVILGSISFYSYRSYQRFERALEIIALAPENATLTEKIFSRLSALETSSRAYALTLNDADYGEYFIKAQNLQMYIDSLVIRSANKSYSKQVDTLRIVFDEKLRSFDALINYKLRADSDGALSTLSLDNSEKSRSKVDTFIMPKTRTEEIEVPDTTDRPNFIQRLFGAEEGTMIVERAITTYDTIYQERKDDILRSVRAELEKVEERRNNRNSLLTQRELDLIEKDQLVVNKLRNLVSDIRSREKQEAMAQKEQTAEEARSSFVRVVWFASLGGLLTVVLVYLLARDFGEERRLRKELNIAVRRARELGKAKEDFLASMSHEIRTPLNAMLGFTEQMRQEQLNQTAAEKAELIAQSGNHLLMLVNDILDFSKIEAGKLHLEEIGFAPETIARESLQAITPMARQKGLEVLFEQDESSVEALVLGDPIRLKQILLNLLGNAVKFTETGFVKLKLERQADGDVYEWWNFAVSDSGKGIEPTKQKAIFESFSQEDNSVSRKYGGTGLGLSISSKILEMHNSQLELESQVGKGSRFWFEIHYPIAQANEYGDGEQREVNAPQLRGVKVLFIDDDPMNQLLLKNYFQKHQIEAVFSSNGRSGLEQAEKGHFDFIFVDLQMPDMSGYEVLEKLRASKSLARECRLVLFTANALVRQQKHPSLALADDLLLKPFGERDLLEVLQRKAPTEVSEKPTKIDYDLRDFKLFAGGDPTLLKEFILAFVEQGESGLASMEEALHSQNYPQLRATAHQLKNTFGQLRVSALAEQLNQLELGKEEEMHRLLSSFKIGAQSLFQSLREEFKA